MLLLILLPALVNRLQAPLGTLLRCANRLVTDEYEDWVGMTARKDSKGDPTGLAQFHLGREILELPISDDLFAKDRLTIDDHLNRYLASFSQPGSLNMPVGLLLVGTIPEVRIRFLIEHGGHPGADSDLARLVDAHLAPPGAHLQ